MKRSLILTLALVIALSAPLMAKENSKVDPKIYKLKNPLRNAKVGDFAHYNVILKSPMSPEPMKSKLITRVIAANEKTVTVRFKTNLMGQQRIEKQIIPRKTPLIQAVLLILRRQFRLKVKIHKAKLHTVKKEKYGKSDAKIKLIDAEVSGIGQKGQKGKNKMKVWIHPSISVFGFLRAKIETEWKLGDTALKLEFTMKIDKHSNEKKSEG